MPKQKTCKSVAKRVKITARGKVRIYQLGRSHLLSGKSSKRKRRMRKSAILTGALARKFKRSLGR